MEKNWSTLTPHEPDARVGEATHYCSSFSPELQETGLDDMWYDPARSSSILNERQQFLYHYQARFWARATRPQAQDLQKFGASLFFLFKSII
jgi:hypothetical protein